MNYTNLNYESTVAITQHPLIWGILIGIFVFTLLVYLASGLRRAKTPSGVKIKKRAIQTSGFWIGLTIWLLIPALLIVSFIIFPWWLRI